MPRLCFVVAILMVSCFPVLPALSAAAEFHVATSGNDNNPGTPAAPLRTIQQAANLAQPGDTVTVHKGVYRERVNPPRGGTSDAKRIVYQAAPGEKVEIKGSEVVKNWVKAQGDIWKVTLPNSFFRGFNPYTNLLAGDWFSAKGREHHTGAVYVNGEWLSEAAGLDDLLHPGNSAPRVRKPGVLLNVAWFRPGKATKKIPAVSHAAQYGVRSAACTEGGQCIGWLEEGDWARYEAVDFGTGSDAVEIRAASATTGGQIELRRNAPDGEVLGTCSVPNTGGWQSWASFTAKIKPLSGVQTLCLVFRGSPETNVPQFSLWFAQVDKDNTTIWAQFKGGNPNEQLVEINARQTVFYPDKPGRNYITVREFTMRHAATPWAPPTAEQIGLLGTHWSKGWTIENNTISHSICSGIALGKYGDEWDNKSQSADAYNETIRRALKNGWSKENIGSHMVRNNFISQCEQAGVVGSMGCAFSVVTNNVIHDISVRQLFVGAERAGIKFHGAIDVQIRHNHIYRCSRGLWLDWMAQGTRVSGNLFHDNSTDDLFVEVDHGPFLIENNVFLSPVSFRIVSQGGAYVHNLIAGKITISPYDARATPFHKPHSTEVAALHDNPFGDDRYYNNLFVVAADLTRYNEPKLPVWMEGNVFLSGTKPSVQEKEPLVKTGFDPAIKIIEQKDGFYLEATFDPAWTSERTRKLITTELLGKAKIPDAAYEQPDGSPIRLNTDYFGKRRNELNPTPGPFENPGSGPLNLKIW